MPLSIDWTVAKIWRNAVRGIPKDRSGEVMSFEMVEIVGLWMQRLCSDFYDLMASSYLTEVAVTPTGNVVDLSAYRIMRTGPQIKMSMKSSSTPDVTVHTPEEVDSFNASAPQNATKIWWSLVGNAINLAKGSGVATYNLTLRYPKVPDVPSAGTSKIDLPDGPAAVLLILLVRQEIATRIKFEMPAMKVDIENAVRDLYHAFGVQAQTEMIKAKVESLK